MTYGRAAGQSLRAWVEEPTLTLGIGSALHGDDAAGPMVCARVNADHAVDCGDAPERYLGRAGDPNVARVLMVDAVDFGGAPGEIAFCRLEDLTERVGTTHTTGLALLVRYLEESYDKPVAVLGIQPADTRFGADISDAVRAAVAEVSAVLKNGTGERPPAQREAAWTRS